MSASEVLRPTAEYWSWRDYGACKGNEELFYNGEAETKGERRSKEARAKAVCAECEVLKRCRNYAIRSRELYGVWGGLTEKERHRLAGRHRSG